jgi:hypothetical protein
MIPDVLGKKVRDRVTGYLGTATARAEYLYGEPRIQIERSGDAEPRWFEEGRVELDAIQTHPRMAPAT